MIIYAVAAWRSVLSLQLGRFCAVPITGAWLSSVEKQKFLKKKKINESFS